MEQTKEERKAIFDAYFKAKRDKRAYNKAMREYTAACVELVERLAGDLPFDPSFPKVACRQIVENMKPEEPK